MPLAPSGLDAQNPFANMNLGGFNFNTPNVKGMEADPNAGGFQNILNMIAQQPTSMVNSMMPNLMQILGLQGNAMMPMLQQQQSGMVAGAQSDAMARGLTGSSIEAGNMTAARAAGNQNINQFMGQQLGHLGNAYTGAVGQDVNQQNQMYQNIAQALGQQMQNIESQRNFAQQMYEGIQQAHQNQRAQGQSGIMGGLGSLGGGLMQGAGMAGGFGNLFSMGGAGAAAGGAGAAAGGGSMMADMAPLMLLA